MSMLLDTNILTRSAQPAHSMHKEALDQILTPDTKDRMANICRGERFV